MSDLIPDPREALVQSEAEAADLQVEIDDKTARLASLRKEIRALKQGVAEREGRSLRCPRRDDAFAPQRDGLDHWESDNTCSYCGSLNPDWLMDRLESGDVQIEPTGKNYKIYVTNQGGTPWTQGGASKFYFQHLSEQQRKRFIELLNAKRFHFAYPGYFYRLPFFIAPFAWDSGEVTS